MVMPIEFHDATSGIPLWEALSLACERRSSPSDTRCVARWGGEAGNMGSKGVGNGGSKCEDIAEGNKLRGDTGGKGEAGEGDSVDCVGGEIVIRVG